jgi:superfamily II DNA/RNA helicase
MAMATHLGRALRPGGTLSSSFSVFSVDQRRARTSVRRAVRREYGGGPGGADRFNDDDDDADDARRRRPGWSSSESRDGRMSSSSSSSYDGPAGRGGRTGGRGGSGPGRRRGWETTGDGRYARLTNRRGNGDYDDGNTGDAMRTVDARTLGRRTERAAARRESGGRGRRGDDAEAPYWGEDEDLSGWARLMGEDASVDARKKKEKPLSSSSSSSGSPSSAYKRGPERPWEKAAREREERRRQSDGSGSEGAESTASTSAFERAGMPARAVEAMREAGLRRTTEIQRLAIPALVAGKNAAILAETGSGKTFAYLLPILAQMTEPGRRGTKRSGRCCPAAVVLVPNVELGRQVSYSAELAAFWCANEGLPTPSVFSLLGKEKKLVKPAAKKKSTSPGAKKKKAPTTKAGKAKLSGDDEVIPEFRNADVLVCTPTRLLKLIKDEWVLLGRLCHVVVDEADEMLSSGFADDLTELLKITYDEDGVNKFDLPVQYVFAAATMREAQPLLDAFPGELEWVSSSQFGRVHPQLQVHVDDVRGDDAKFNALVESIERRRRYKSLIFANSPEEADTLVNKLDEKGIVALAFHGKAKERGVVLDDFIAGELSVCVCTDLAARGIDFPELHHVVQYGAAPSMEMHLHRCGRTARMGQEGPFYVTCIVDSQEEDIEETVARELGVKRRYDRSAGGDVAVV